MKSRLNLREHVQSRPILKNRLAHDPANSGQRSCLSRHLAARPVAGTTCRRDARDPVAAPALPAHTDADADSRKPDTRQRQRKYSEAARPLAYRQMPEPVCPHLPETDPGPHFRMKTGRQCWRCAFRNRAMLRRSILTSAVVGTILVAINQGTVIIGGDATTDLAWKIPSPTASLLRRQLGRPRKRLRQRRTEMIPAPPRRGSCRRLRGSRSPTSGNWTVAALRRATITSSSGAGGTRSIIISSFIVAPYKAGFRPDRPYRCPVARVVVESACSFRASFPVPRLHSTIYEHDIYIDCNWQGNDDLSALLHHRRLSGVAMGNRGQRWERGHLHRAVRECVPGPLPDGDEELRSESGSPGLASLLLRQLLIQTTVRFHALLLLASAV